MKCIIFTVIFVAVAKPAVATLSDIEGGVIDVQQDTLSWPQLTMVKTALLLLWLQWVFGALPVNVSVPLHKLVRRSLEEEDEETLRRIPDRFLHMQAAEQQHYTLIERKKKSKFSLQSMLKSFMRSLKKYRLMWLFKFFYNLLDYVSPYMMSALL